MTDVIVNCRVCGGQAPASQFKLSIEHKVMVCPNCMKKKTSVISKPQVAVEKKQESKPAGWDAEDALLEKLAKQKPTTAEIPKTGKGVLSCKKCSYPIKMDFDAKRPNNCPYCGKDIY